MLTHEKVVLGQAYDHDTTKSQGEDGCVLAEYGPKFRSVRGQVLTTTCLRVYGWIDSGLR